MDTASDPWGRVDDDGTVYVRTAEGERVVGSWQAGSPGEALAFFKRKFDSLETEVVLLEQRISGTDLSPGQAQATIERLLHSIKEARAVGDLDGLITRLQALTGLVDSRREETKAAREQAKTEAKDIKERIVAEAERIVTEATHWKVSGERMRQLLEEWKAAPHADRAIETALWKRFSAARNSFTKRRKAYFAGLEEERETARLRKEKLCSQAEELSSSTDWGGTASAFRDLMRSWKEAGRAGRSEEESLWTRFKAAQDQFFQARSAVYSAKEAELREHATVKEQLLAEADALLPVSDLRAAKAAMRGIQERWEKAGSVPRDSREKLESGLRRVEEALRKVEDTQWRRSNPEALARAEGTVAQIKATIEQLEKRLAKARETGDTKTEQQATEALTARRAWLVEAERALAEFSG
ncbi:MAG TPA: DUF349 domain-containing protein [Streptosporangiaceae bacterium]